MIGQGLGNGEQEIYYYVLPSTIISQLLVPLIFL